MPKQAKQQREAASAIMVRKLPPAQLERVLVQHARMIARLQRKRAKCMESVRSFTREIRATKKYMRQILQDATDDRSGE